MNLKLFTDPWINLHIPRQAFIDLFVRLIPLLPYKHALPNPGNNDAFPQSLAELLAGANELPPAVLQAFADIEALATLEKQPLDSPDLNIDPDRHESSRLRNAIYQWLGRGSPADCKPGLSSASAPGVPTPNSSSSSFSSSSSPPQSDHIGDSAPNNSVAVPLAASQPTAAGAASDPGPSPVSQPPETCNLQPATCNDSSVPSVSSCKISDSETFSRLAALSPSDYDRVREKEAAHLHLRVRTLDTQVSRVRTQLEMEAQTKTIHLTTFQPWAEPVIGAELLHEILARFNAYAYMSPASAVAATLWTGHVPAFEAFHLTPRLNLTSEYGGCGKTTVLDLIAALLSRSLRFESLTPAVLFRIINLLAPVMLLDEVDSYLPYNDELRGLLNAGHKRNSHAYRCEGERYTIRAFKAFAPAVLAGIGDLPGTLRDRSIIIHMSPAPAGQSLTRFDPLHLEAETILAKKLARWAKDNFAALAACDPPLPPTAYNRLADNWRPLFAVAQVAGGDWPALALDAFNKLTATRQAADPGVTLLSDIRGIFANAGTSRLFSSQLVEHLRAIPHRPWSNNHATVNQTWLGRRLARFGISSFNLRIGTVRAKGYDLAHFSDAFAQHLNGAAS